MPYDRKVKHERDKHFRKANLKNTLHAIGGLAVLVSYLYQQELIQNKFWPIPQFIFVSRKYNRGFMGRMDPMYQLPDFPKPETKKMSK